MSFQIQIGDKFHYNKMLCRRVLKVYYVYTRILYLRSIVINEIHVANLLANNSFT